MKKGALLFLAIVTLICSLTACETYDDRLYEEASVLLEQGDYDEARKRFEQITDRDVSTQINECLYCKAKDLLEQGDYDEARKRFEQITDRDVSTQINECLYCKAKVLQEEGLITEAYQMFLQINSYKDVSDILAGNEFLNELWSTKRSVVSFGQNDWIVLDVNDDQTLLLSKDVLYTTEIGKVNNSQLLWKNSNVRKYLNHDFLDSYFSEAEKQCIITRTITTFDRTAIYTYSYPKNREEDERYETEDAVFLLSDEEVYRYRYEAEAVAETCLLRTTAYYNTGEVMRMVCTVDRGGEIYTTPHYTEYFNTSYRKFPDLLFIYEYSTFGIRPAMWVNRSMVLEIHKKYEE